ncbi:helix-turn-helix domain-containing protein [Microbacterium paludicola]|uniref:helix-turn-helix domain-containing protein n=1 Tax=Microbacterium paludicola TaxID=300019 RepID=UPI003878FEE3
MAPKNADGELELGPTGKVVAAQVARKRKERALSYAELSKRLTELGSPIPTLGLRRIEARARRVSVDDLLALSAALGVSPAELLIDVSDEESLPTGVAGDITAIEALAWIRGETDLSARSRSSYLIRVYYQLEAESQKLSSMLESKNRKAAAWAERRLDRISKRIEEVEERISELRMQEDAEDDDYLVVPDPRIAAWPVMHDEITGEVSFVKDVEGPGDGTT